MRLDGRHILALRVISGRGHGTGRHRPEDLDGLGDAVSELIAAGLVRPTRYGRAERLTKDGVMRLEDIDNGCDCESPYEVNGVAHVSNYCPVHNLYSRQP